VEQSSRQRPQGVPVTGRVVDKSNFAAEQYDDDIWPTRMPTSTRRYQSDVKTETGRKAADVQDEYHFVAHNPHGRKNAVPARRTATAVTPAVQPASRRQVVNTDEIAIHKPYKRRQFHWLVYAGMALCVMLAGWVILTVVSNWWQVTQDDWHYGRPRTYQVDQAVGHNDSPTNPSHFIALNLNRHVEVIEFQGGDASKSKIYLGPILTGPGQDLAPVTLSFRDVTGDHKLDMILNIQGSHFVFVNDNGQFRTPKPNEIIQP
jgi:hypothetical protein